MKASLALHGALAPLDEACRLAGDGCVCLAGLMAEGGGRSVLARKGSVGIRHLGLLAAVLRHRHARCVLVRDFSNVPLAALFPLVRRRRDALLFLVNHNLQWALAGGCERAAFRLLGRLGCRFAFFEQVPVDELRRLGVPVARCQALPHPVPDSPFRRERTGGVATVGVIGQYRPEKGIDEVLARLAPLASAYRVVVALPNLGAFRAASRFATAGWFEAVDTSRFDDYRRAVAACDAVVLNHPPEGYACRASGLIADAAAAGVPVVVRNLPILRRQVEWPVRIGECFDVPGELAACIGRVSARLEAGAYRFDEYRQARSAVALSLRLQEIAK